MAEQWVPAYCLDDSAARILNGDGYMLPKGLLKEYSRAIAVLVRFVDLLLIAFFGWLAYWMRFKTTQLDSSYFTAVGIGVFFAAVIFSFFNLYMSMRGERFVLHVVRLLEALFGVFLALAGVALLTKSGAHYSRLWFAAWMLLNVFGLIAVRLLVVLLLRTMRTRGLNERRVVIIGANAFSKQLAQTVEAALWTGFHVEGFLDESAGESILPAITQYLKQGKVDEVWIALSLKEEVRVKQIVFELRHLTIPIRLALDIFGIDLFNYSLTEVAGIPVLNIRSTPMRGVNRFVKACEDRLLALVALLLLSPLLFLIALCVKGTSRGPVLFKQARLGRDSRVIKVYKFRTMYVHTEAPNQVTQASLGDKRITPLGKWLRKTSLDELPQLINVLQGRMSMVGPRPHALPHNEWYKDKIHTYMQRHRVKPGITGWAQVNGWRGETDTVFKMEKRIEYDLYYINNWSLAFDIKILFLTCCRGFFGRNAY